MANAKQIETSLLTEHLRYTPLAIIDDVINTVNLLVERAVDAVESGLLSTDPETLGFASRALAEGRRPHTNAADDDDDDDDARAAAYPEMAAEIEHGVHQLETLLAANVDKNFDKFELYALRNVFAIDAELVPWIRLGHYQGVDADAAAGAAVAGEAAPSLESVRTARRKLQETRRLNGLLRAERARNERLLRELRAVAGTSQQRQQDVKMELADDDTVEPPQSRPAADFSFLTSTPAAQALGMRPLSPSSPPDAKSPGSRTGTNSETLPTPLATNTSFTLAQLPALKALLAELKPKIGTLHALDAGGTQGRFARERGEYVETQTMRILERRGVDLDRDVDGGRAGAGLGARRAVGREEVEALERIVSAMGGDASASARGRGRGRGEEVQAVGGASDDDDAMEE